MPSPPTPTPHPITSSTVITSVCAAHNLTTSEFHALHTRASEAKALAYCPYSNFRVGAALLTRSGHYITGANVENASYPVTTCAERVAFGTAVVAGYHQQRQQQEGGNVEEAGFKAVAVATDSDEPCSPCGMCRQFIREFCEKSVPIIMFDKDSNFVVMTLGELLPLSFGPGALGAPDPAKP